MKLNAKIFLLVALMIAAVNSLPRMKRQGHYAGRPKGSHQPISSPAVNQPPSNQGTFQQQPAVLPQQQQIYQQQPAYGQPQYQQYPGNQLGYQPIQPFYNGK